MWFHIDELEEASKDSNPAKFTLAFNSFKVFVVANWTQVDYDLNVKTRKEIEEVFNIENSSEFRIYKFIADNLDYFFRFAYMACFVLFICLKMSFLYDLEWLYGLSIALFILAFALYTLAHIREKMIENEWTFSTAFRYYAKMRCIFPKRQLLKAKAPSDKKKKK